MKYEEVAYKLNEAFPVSKNSEKNREKCRLFISYLFLIVVVESKEYWQ